MFAMCDGSVVFKSYEDDNALAQLATRAGGAKQVSGTLLTPFYLFAVSIRANQNFCRSSIRTPLISSALSRKPYIPSARKMIELLRGS